MKLQRLTRKKTSSILTGGEVVWGPELLATSLSAEQLRSMVADALDLSFHRVHLAKDAKLIDGQMSLKALGAAVEKGTDFQFGFKATFFGVFSNILQSLLTV